LLTSGKQCVPAKHPAGRLRKEEKWGKPISAFPRLILLLPVIACYCLLLKPLTLPSQKNYIDPEGALY
jgi:hypothetical protein